MQHKVGQVFFFHVQLVLKSVLLPRDVQFIYRREDSVI